MKNEFIPYDEALALKELGFDEACLASYNHTNHDKSEWIFEIWNDEDSDLYFEPIRAPLYQQAFKWFREKYKLHVEPFVDDDETYGYLITQFIKPDGNAYYLRADKPIKRGFDTYEEAQLACLKQLIKIVQNENSEN